MSTTTMWIIYGIGAFIGLVLVMGGTSERTTDKEARRYLSMVVIWPLFLLVVVAKETYDFLVDNPVEEDDD